MHFISQSFGVAIGKKHSPGHYSIAQSVDIACYERPPGSHRLYCGKAKSFMVCGQYGDIGRRIYRSYVGTRAGKHHAFVDSKSFSHTDMFLKGVAGTCEHKSIIIRKERKCLKHRCMIFLWTECRHHNYDFLCRKSLPDVCGACSYGKSAEVNTIGDYADFM